MSNIFETLGSFPGPHETVEYVAVESQSHEEQLNVAAALFDNTQIDENGVAICHDPVSGDRTRLAIARIGSEVVHEPLVDNQSDGVRSLDLELPLHSSPQVFVFVGSEPPEDDRTPPDFSRSVVIRASYLISENIPAARVSTALPQMEDGVRFHVREIPFRLTDGEDMRNPEENRIADAVGIFDKLGFSQRHTRGIGNIITFRQPEGRRIDQELTATPGVSFDVGVFLTRQRQNKAPEARALHAVFPITVKGV